MIPEKPRHDGESCCQIHAYVLPCPICEAANKPNQICIGYDDDQPVFVDRDSPQSALQAARNKANATAALGTQEGELPVRCPKCRMNWQAFPPARYDDLVVRADGSTCFENTNGYRCIECKSDFRVPTNFASQARTIEALRAALTELLDAMDAEAVATLKSERMRENEGAFEEAELKAADDATVDAILTTSEAMNAAIRALKEHHNG